MSQQEITGVTERDQQNHNPRITRHDVVFQLRVVAFNGQPVNDDTPYGDALLKTDDKVFDALPSAVTNWKYRDHDDLDGERLEMYQPEFGHDPALPDDATLYDVGVCSTTELPRLRVETTEDKPISVQQLVEEVVPLLIRMYGDAGVTLELHKVRFAMQYEASTSGTYEFN